MNKKLVETPKPEPDAWWVQAAQPEDRDKFMRVAAERATQGWTNVVAHAKNVNQ